MDIKNIKVTASYEEAVSSKFDALCREYEAAKKIADETQRTIAPLIEASGKAKLELICRQLETIVENLKYIAGLADREDRKCAHSETIVYHDRLCEKRHSINVSVRWTPGGWMETIYLDGWLIEDERDQWFEEDGIVTNWNKSHAYERLQEDCERQLKKRIEHLQNNTEKLNRTFENMQNN